MWDVKRRREDWDFARYNSDEAAIRTFMAEKDAKPIVVPHRANRAVIFDSDLFHETDKILVFQDGYENRRINVTLLYGRRVDRPTHMTKLNENDLKSVATQTLGHYISWAKAFRRRTRDHDVSQISPLC